MTNKKLFKAFSILSITALTLSQVALNLSMPVANAAELSNASVSLSDSRPSETNVTYTSTFSNVSSTSIQCITLDFNTAADGTGTVPTGMDTTSATLNSSSTYITPANWTVDATTNGTVKLTYTTGEAGTNGTVILDGITNGSTADTGYFLRFNTYSDSSCTTQVDHSTVMFIYTNGQLVSLTVDPTLSFSISSVASGQSVNGATTNVATTTTTVPFGTVTTSTDVVAAHDLSVTTNATNGYTVYTRYTGPLTNGSGATIDNVTGSNATPASFDTGEAFGYTTNDATLSASPVDRFTTGGGDKWAAFTTSNAEVAYASSAVDNETTRVGYQVGISGTTEAGTYTTTVVYTATPTY